MFLICSAFIFSSSDEVLHIIQCLIGSLQRARTALVLPKKKAIDELMKSRNMVNMKKKITLGPVYGFNLVKRFFIMK